MDEQEYKKALAESGVKVEEDQGETKPEPESAPPVESEKQPEEKPDEKTEKVEDKPNAPVIRKRSIYDEYKDKKTELKSERAERERLEKEVNDLKSRLEQANTADEKKEVQDDIEAFAKEIGADVQAIRKMRELFLKDVKPSTVDEKLLKEIDDLKKWKSEYEQDKSKITFEQEFSGSVGQLKTLFPNASDDDIANMRPVIEKLAHTEGWHDKEIDYIAFRNRETLAKLVTPRKKGMENKSRQDSAQIDSDFDPNADLSRMSSKQLEAWEQEYRKATGESNNAKIISDSRGRKIIT